MCSRTKLFFVTKPAEMICKIINKNIVPLENRRGRIGYGLVLITRLHVYEQIKCLNNDTELYRHLQETGVWKDLGFVSLPDRTQFGRWRRNKAEKFHEISDKISDLISEILGITEVHTDSTPLEDEIDKESKWGKTSDGWFCGYKLHSSVNQFGFPLRCKVTPGNVYDGPVMPELICDLNAAGAIATGDGAYDSAENKDAIKAIGAIPKIARNKRRWGKRRHTPALCKHLRYKVEQFNSLAKEFMKERWRRYKGLQNKKGFVYSAVLALNIIALWNVLKGTIEEARKVAVYWY